jgi:hypothetical protein
MESCLWEEAILLALETRDIFRVNSTEGTLVSALLAQVPNEVRAATLGKQDVMPEAVC